MLMRWLKLINDYTLSIVIAQLNLLLDTYEVNLHDLSDLRELAYREGYIELYHLISEHPTKYFHEVLHTAE